MQSYVEHANISVSNLDSAVNFFSAALPDFKIRKRWTIDDDEWAHVGTDSSYVALVMPLHSSAPQPDGKRKGMSGFGFNHVGFVVEDVDATQQRLLEAGFKGGYNSGEIIEHPSRKSVYFLDSDGNEFEFMQYLAANSSERNLYEN